MNQSEKTLQFIERYLREELNGKELKSFQQRMDTDKNFADMVALEKQIVQVVEEKAKQRFRQRLDKIHEEEIETKVSQVDIESKLTSEQVGELAGTKFLRSIIRNKWWLMAASILFILALFYFLFPSKTLSTEQLFAQNYELPAFENNRNTQSIIPINAAKIAYQNKDFQKTINSLTPYLLTNYDEHLALFLGVSYLELNQFKAAISTFEEIKNQTDVKDDATWYLALTYLKKGDKMLAKKQLQELLGDFFLVTPKRKVLAQQLLIHLEN